MMLGTLSKCSTPMYTGDHPEDDDTAILDYKHHKMYQQLLGY